MAAVCLSCSMWDLVPSPGIEPRFPELGPWSSSHWTTGKLPHFLMFYQPNCMPDPENLSRLCLALWTSPLKRIYVKYFVKYFLILLNYSRSQRYNEGANWSSRYGIWALKIFTNRWTLLSWLLCPLNGTSCIFSHLSLLTASCKAAQFECHVLFEPKWQPTPVLLPGKSHGQRSLVGYSP